MRKTPITNEKQAAANGRGTARGTSGTAWMAALDSIVEEAIKACGIQSYPSDDVTHEKLMERLQKYADGWTETCQFEYEVGRLFTTSLEDEERMLKIINLQDAWVMGYTEILFDKVVTKLSNDAACAATEGETETKEVPDVQP